MLPLLLTAALVVLPPDARAGEAAVVRLSLRLMAAPKPALRYQLLPEVRELKPGNPVQWYMRCFAEQRRFFFDTESVAERAKYRSMPLAELPVGKLRGYGGSALTQADWGARLDTPDWQVLERVQAEGADLPLPELEPLRVLAESLQVRFRLEVAGRDYDAAVRTAKTMFALARHLGEHPTTAAGRVGLEVTGMALDTLEEMVQQPGCPNLYWALTHLPAPLVDLRKGVQGDRALADAELAPVRDDAPMTDSQVEEFVARLSGRVGFAREQAGRPPRNLRAALAARVKDPEQVRAARDRMIAPGGPGDPLRGLAALRVVSFPPMQVVLLDEKWKYELRRDEHLKLAALAPWEIESLTRGKEPAGDGGLFADLVPRVVELRRTQARLEQRVAILRHVEALRMYAADHGGKFPEKLSDIGVPLPADPFTGKPFAYALDGATAHLRGTPPKGEEKNPAYTAHYEIVIRK
jgi:hypothetical protein